MSATTYEFSDDQNKLIRNIDGCWRGRASPMYFDRDGYPITLGEWSVMFSDNEYTTIQRTTIGEFLVSTVWLGLNHAHRPGPPEIFETMVFRGSFSDQYCERYAAEKEARAGHAAVVERISRGETFDQQPK